MGLLWPKSTIFRKGLYVLLLFNICLPYNIYILGGSSRYFFRVFLDGLVS